jgi:hypothetical protein
LYHLPDDIGESNNLIDAPDQRDRITTMKSKLKKWLSDTDSKMPTPNPNFQKQ